jgi:hypothetical protein
MDELLSFSILVYLAGMPFWLVFWDPIFYAGYP